MKIRGKFFNRKIIFAEEKRKRLPLDSLKYSSLPWRDQENYVPQKYPLRRKRLSKPFAVADFETILDKNRNHRVVAAGFRFYPSGSHEKARTFTFKLDPRELTEENLEFKSRALILNFIKDLRDFLKKKTEKLRKDQSKTIVTYFHNFGSFDGIFILEALQKEGGDLEFSPLIRNGRLYQLQVSELSFRDSYLLLPESLDKLGRSFLNQQKEEFPLEKLSLNNYKERNLALELYMKKDIELLGDILKIFQKEIREEFSLDIAGSLSLSGLSYQLYRTNFMPAKTIHISTRDKEVNDFLQRAYMGGFTELYKPRPQGKVYVYDVNSAYPFVMAKYPMPAGSPQQISEKESSKIDLEKFFGFLDVTVFVEEDQYVPPLVTRDPFDGNLCSPVGFFREVYFSEELKEAQKNGTTVIFIHEAYAYKPRPLFDSFVTEIYRRRREAEVDGLEGKALIYKSILNSLYGRFAMRGLESLTKIVKNEDLEILKNFQGLSNPKPILGTDSTIVTLHPPFPEPPLDEEIDKNYIENWRKAKESFEKEAIPSSAFFVATQISAATTAYARSHIFRIKKELLKEGYEIYYSDTDSVFINKALPKDHKLLGESLGKLKLEGIYREGIFLGAKVYAFIEETGKEKIVWKGLPLQLREKLSYKDYLKAWEDGQSLKTFSDKVFRRKWKELSVSEKELKFRPGFEYKKRQKVFEEREGKKVWVDTRPLPFEVDEKIFNLYYQDLEKELKRIEERNFEENRSFSSEISLNFEEFKFYMALFKAGFERRGFKKHELNLHPLLAQREDERSYLFSSFQLPPKGNSERFFANFESRISSYRRKTRGAKLEDLNFQNNLDLHFQFYETRDKEKILNFAHSLKEGIRKNPIQREEKLALFSGKLERKYPLFHFILTAIYEYFNLIKNYWRNFYYTSLKKEDFIKNPSIRPTGAPMPTLGGMKYYHQWSLYHRIFGKKKGKGGESSSKSQKKEKKELKK